jgi:hypothetical protein
VHLTEQEINKLATEIAYRQQELDSAYTHPSPNVHRAVTEILYKHFGLTTRRVDPDRQLADRVPNEQLDMPVRFAKPQRPIEVERLQQEGLYPLQLAAAEVKFGLIQQLLYNGEKVAGPLRVDVNLVGRVRAVKIDQKVAEQIPLDEVPRYPYSSVEPS